MADTRDTAKRARGDAARDKLLALVEEAHLFHTPEGHPYAAVPVDGHEETFAVHDRAFVDFLRARCYREHQIAPTSAAVSDVVEHAASLARYAGPEERVWVRTAEHAGRVYIDLGNVRWEAAEIDGEGWRIVSHPPVRFRRPASALAFPTPSNGLGAALTLLERYVHLDADGLLLLYSFLAYALRPGGPYPILVVLGEQGSGKSFLTEIVRRLVDPSSVPLRAAPRDERDLMIMAENSHVLAFNNVSQIPAWLSDAFCTLTNGSGLSTRRLHSDRGEETFQYCRPIVVNGIEELAVRPDLADRAVTLRLPWLPDAARRDEAELRAAFERDLPKIVGALFGAVHVGLSRLDIVRQQRPVLPRVADFGLFAVAAQIAYAPPDADVLAALRRNRNESRLQSRDTDPVVHALLRLAESEGEWTGSTSDLHAHLLNRLAPSVPSDFPRSRQQFVARISRVVPVLRSLGVSVMREKSNRRGRSIQIRLLPETDA